MIGDGLSQDAARRSYLFADGENVGNAAMLVHILAGSFLVVLVPLQLLKGLRLKYNRFHRLMGACLVALALITGLAGMSYIPLRGTIGGPLMSAAFFLYGLCLFTAALMVALAYASVVKAIFLSKLLGAPVNGWRWKKSSTASRTRGTRVEPPTMTTSSTLSTSASRRQRRQARRVRFTNGCISDSNASLLRVRVSAPGIMSASGSSTESADDNVSLALRARLCKVRY